jgi:hypothetical protein
VGKSPFPSPWERHGIGIGLVPCGNCDPEGTHELPPATSAISSNYDGNSVRVIAPATKTVVGSPITVGFPYGVAVIPDSSKVYVSNNGGTVSVISQADGFVPNMQGSRPMARIQSPTRRAYCRVDRPRPGRRGAANRKSPGFTDEVAPGSRRS